MRKMFSQKQIEEMISEGSLTPQQVYEMLVGKYVRIMDAPESTTLSEEEANRIIEGTFIDGDFLNLKNPVFFPARLIADTIYTSVVIGYRTGGDCFIGTYQITKVGNIISLRASTNKSIDLGSIDIFNGKNVPNYPSDTGTFILKCVDGTLTWVEEV